MSYNRRLTIIAIITYLLLIPLAVHFKYFTMIINATISNVFIFLLIYIVVSLLVYGGFIIKTSKDIYYILPQSLIFIFIVRAAPNLVLSYPPLHDPYYHFAAALNVINYGTLEPILGWWYSGTDMQLHWPIMHLLTTALVSITNVDVMQFFRYQEPAMGIMYFLAVFMLAKTVTNDDLVAILSALFASLSDIIIFYQSEYHPQGLAITFFMLLIYTFIKSRNTNNILFRFVSLILIVVFILSHYFTPLFLAIIFSAYLVVLATIGVLSRSMPMTNKLYNMIEMIKSDYNFLFIVMLLPFAYHFLVYTNFVNEVLRNSIHEDVLNAQLVSIAQTEIPLITSVFTSSKWGLFALAAISILWIFKTKNANEFRLSVFFISIIVAGIIGNYVVTSPLDRIIAFCVPFAAVFASLTLFRFKNEWFKNIHENKKIIFIVLIASALMTAGVLNSQTPAYFFKDSGVNTYYWYSNRLPSMDEYKVAGEWIGSYSINDSKYGTEFDTRIIPYFYGKKSDNSIMYEPTAKSFNYMLTNPSIPYKYNKTAYISNLNLIYNNKELEVHS